LSIRMSRLVLVLEKLQIPSQSSAESVTEIADLFFLFRGVFKS
jgi:hypothetical protein